MPGEPPGMYHDPFQIFWDPDWPPKPPAQDDTDHIRAMMAQAAENGGELYIPPGEYVVTGQIDLLAPVRGSGSTTHITYTPSSLYEPMFYRAHNEPSHPRRVSVRDIRVTVSGSSGGMNSYAVWSAGPQPSLASNSWGLTVSDVSILGGRVLAAGGRIYLDCVDVDADGLSGGGLYLARCSGLVKDCSVTGATAHPATEDGALTITAVAGLLISNVSVSGNSNTGISCGPGSTGVVLYSCRIEGNNDGGPQVEILGSGDAYEGYEPVVGLGLHGGTIGQPASGELGVLLKNVVGACAEANIGGDAVFSDSVFCPRVQGTSSCDYGSTPETAGPGENLWHDAHESGLFPVGYGTAASSPAPSAAVVALHDTFLGMHRYGSGYSQNPPALGNQIHQSGAGPYAIKLDKTGATGGEIYKTFIFPDGSEIFERLAGGHASVAASVFQEKFDLAEADINDPDPSNWTYWVTPGTVIHPGIRVRARDAGGSIVSEFSALKEDTAYGWCSVGASGAVSDPGAGGQIEMDLVLKSTFGTVDPTGFVLFMDIGLYARHGSAYTDGDDYGVPLGWRPSIVGRPMACKNFAIGSAAHMIAGGLPADAENGAVAWNSAPAVGQPMGWRRYGGAWRAFDSVT